MKRQKKHFVSIFPGAKHSQNTGAILLIFEWLGSSLCNVLKRWSGIVLYFACIPGLSAQNQHRNIVLIMADDLGFECIGVNGGTSYYTPNIDKLAAQGMRFENCHAQPLCTPTRVQLMTGLYNVRNYTIFGQLDRNQKCFAGILEAAGYKTAIAGKWQLGREQDSPQHFGFEESCLWQQSLPRADSIGHDTRFSNPILEYNGEIRYFTNGEFGPDLVSDFICEFIEKNKDQPFFAYYPMLLTHCPFVPTPDSKAWDPKSKGSLTYKGNPDYFPDMVSYMDQLVGKVVTKIDELGLDSNTLVIFTGDNGTDQPIVSMYGGKTYPGGKGLTSDNGTHVPLILRCSGTIETGSENFDLIDFSDFFPTICEFAKIDTPMTDMDGVSFLPQLLKNKSNRRKWIYCWYSRNGKIDEVKEFARDKDFKLYSTGEFYHVRNDFFEGSPLDLDKLNNKEKQSYTTLKKTLTGYKNIRK